MAVSTITQQMLVDVSNLYVALFGRAPDGEGLSYWAGELAGGKTTTEIADAMFAVTPARAYYPTFYTNELIIKSMYENVLGRPADADGLTYWTAKLNDPAATPGSVIAEMVAVVVNYTGTDAAGLGSKALFAAKAAVSLYFGTQNATIAQAATALVGVTATTPVTDAALAAMFNPAASLVLTASTDTLVGTAADDYFQAYLSQNVTIGGVSNTLSSADALNGSGGIDTLYAEIVPEFFGSTGSHQIDIQPMTTSIEVAEFEARESIVGATTATVTMTVDAKWMSAIDKIGSSYSDADLIIENLTTLTDAGVARNTEAITITMDHTDNFNTDGDASDLHVYFDDDYLLAGQVSESKAVFFLLDEEADRLDNPNRLDKINVDGITFSIDGGPDITLENPAAQTAKTHQGFVNALQAALQAKIADGTLPAGTTLTLDPTQTDFTFLDDGSQSDLIPAILLTMGDGSKIVTAKGFSQVEDAIGEYDVYGRFGESAKSTAEPITVNIELEKVGRDGEGGDLIIGGKEQLTDPINTATSPLGITEFQVTVLGKGGDGADARPSNLGMLSSTNGVLETVYITSAETAGSYASLTIRDGFGINDDLKLVNADAFKGDLSLGVESAVSDLDNLTAQGGGNVTFNAALTGTETNQAYSYTTGVGADTVTIAIDGDATDYASSSLNVLTGAGKDSVTITAARSTVLENNTENEILNQVILKNITIDTGADADTVKLGVNSNGDTKINTGAGDDVIYTDGGTAGEKWAFNFDDARGFNAATAQGDLPGVQPSLAYLAGAKVTVTLSGAGLAAAGGGVMEAGNIDLDGNFFADAHADGYESTATEITTLINGNSYYGDQRDINAAIVKAIASSAVLSKLLTATISSNNTLVITTKTSGTFNADDLEITIAQMPATTYAHATAVLVEAEKLFKSSDLTLADLWGTEYTTASFAAANAADGYVGADDPASIAPAAGKIDANSTLAQLNDYYTGLGVDNAVTFTNGAASTSETDNIINGGDGNDVIVLSTDAVAGPDPMRTVSSNNALLNGASNETIVMTGTNFGKDTVMNFTANFALAGGLYTGVGGDFLNYDAYLTSTQSPSGSTASTALIAQTLDTANATEVNANEVTVLRYTNVADTTDLFGGLSATVIASLFSDDVSNTDVSYGDFDDVEFTVKTSYDDSSVTGDLDIELVSGAAKSIVMVENGVNWGEYKVFELSWYGGATTTTSTHQVAVNEIGTLDFGTTLTDLSAVNLTGSAEYAALMKAANFAYAGTVVVPVPAVATIVPVAATVTEGTNAVFNITGTNLVAGMAFSTGVLNVTSATAATFTLPTVVDAVETPAETVTLTVAGVTSAAVTLAEVAAGPTVVVITTTGTVAGTTAVTHNANAPAGTNYQYDVTLGTYTFDIANFAAGDVLNFPDGGNAPSVTNDAFGDGIVFVDFASGGQTVRIQLTGVPAATDALLNDVAAFNTVFGAGTII